MCGIYGVVSRTGRSAPDRSWLTGMGALIRHRGPDDEGVYSDGGAAFGMRRLSIIDVAGGHQPIANEDESLRIVCNGEIYNFKELRAELESRGHLFRTASDSEAALHLYEQMGDSFAGRLEGMFGLAIWDSRRQRLVIARDRLGIKPLYLLEHPEWFCFASEAKAFLALPFFSAGLSRTALVDFLQLGYVPRESSLFAGVERLLPGSVAVWENGRIRRQRYWVLPRQTSRFRSEQDAADALADSLESAVSRQMVADVPIGAFLSGGIDSSTVVAYMSRHSDRPIRTYSIGYEGGRVARLYNELPYAREVARYFGTEHHEIVVKSDVARLLPRLVWHLDEPIADSAMITTYLVSEFASRDVKVILSGVGGDELFGGYTRYLGEHYMERFARLPRWLRNGILKPLIARLPSDRHSKFLGLIRYARSVLAASDLPLDERYQSLLEVCNAERIRALCGADAEAQGVIADLFRNAPEGDWLHKMLAADIGGQLCDDLLAMTDRMSMATSLECRVPLLDENLVSLASSIPVAWKIKGGKLKHLLKAAVALELPPSVLQRSKRGFGAPIGAWLRNELLPLVEGLLSSPAIARRGLLDAGAVQRIVKEHQARRSDHSDVLLALIVFELWCRLFLDRTSVADLETEIDEVVAMRSIRTEFRAIPSSR